MNISLKNTFYAMACAAGVLILLYFGKVILIPVAIALLLSFILFPVCMKLEQWHFSRVWAAITALFSMVVVILGVLFLFSTQIASLVSDFSDFGQKIMQLVEQVIDYVNKNIAILPTIEKSQVIDKSQEWVKKSGGSIVSGTFAQTASILYGLITVAVCTFLLLIYRSGLKTVFVRASDPEKKNEVSKMINEIQKVGQQYLVGMSIMIVILGTANSIALLIIGIEHAVFFGFLAALLGIIPYVGTTIGASLPTIFALMTEESLFIPLAVILSFWFIQTIENNFLSPKIVGGNLNINALAAILSLILGGYLWGVAGMALFLPLMAIFKVFCGHFEQLKPISLLIGDELYESDDHDKNLLTKAKEKIKKLF